MAITPLPQQAIRVNRRIRRDRIWRVTGKMSPCSLMSCGPACFDIHSYGIAYFTPGCVLKSHKQLRRCSRNADRPNDDASDRRSTTGASLGRYRPPRATPLLRRADPGAGIRPNRRWRVTSKLRCIRYPVVLQRITMSVLGLIDHFRDTSDARWLIRGKACFAPRRGCRYAAAVPARELTV
jgi:hypothetical protein